VRPSGLPWKRSGRETRRKAHSREDPGLPSAILPQTAEAVTTNSSVPTPKPGTPLPVTNFVLRICSFDFVLRAKEGQRDKDKEEGQSLGSALPTLLLCPCPPSIGDKGARTKGKDKVLAPLFPTLSLDFVFLTPRRSLASVCSSAFTRSAEGGVNGKADAAGQALFQQSDPSPILPLPAKAGTTNSCRVGRAISPRIVCADSLPGPMARAGIDRALGPCFFDFVLPPSGTKGQGQRGRTKFWLRSSQLCPWTLSSSPRGGRWHLFVVPRSRGLRKAG